MKARTVTIMLTVSTTATVAEIRSASVLQLRDRQDDLVLTEHLPEAPRVDVIRQLAAKTSKRRA